MQIAGADLERCPFQKLGGQERAIRTGTDAVYVTMRAWVGVFIAVRSNENCRF